MGSFFRAAARLCLLVRETGARPGEWANAQWSNLDLARRRITFTNTKYKNQPRTIPLTEAALTLLSEQLEDVAIRNIDEAMKRRLLPGGCAGEDIVWADALE